MWIMIAAPYTSGGADAALRAARLAEMNRAALALLRLGGESQGADQEVARFAQAGKPVYYALTDIPPV
jgi:hypothetical protein